LTSKEKNTSKKTLRSLDIHISKDAKELEASSTNIKNLLLWSSGAISSGVVYQGLMSIAFIVLSVFLGMQQGQTYFWSFVTLTIALVISNILTMIIGPFIGSLSDIIGKRKILVIILTSISLVIFACITSFMNFWFTIVLFTIGNLFFQLGNIVYNSQVLFISKTRDRGTAFGFNGIFSNFGSILAFIVSIILFYTFGEFTDLTDLQNMTISADQIEFGGLKWMFLICAGIMFLSLLPYSFTKEKQKSTDISNKITTKEILKRTSSDLKTSIKDTIKDRNLMLFLFGWTFVSIGTTIITIYYYEIARRIAECTHNQAILALVVVAFAAIISSYITGIFVDEIGPKIAFIFNSFFIIFGVIISIGSNYTRLVTNIIQANDGHFVSVTTILHFNWWLIYFGAFFLGLSIGGFWVVGKQFLIELAPPKKIGQYFSFMGVFTQFGTLIAPLLFYLSISFMNDIFSEENSYRISLFIILGLFIVSIVIFAFIKDVHPRYIAGERTPYSPTSRKIKRKSQKMNFIVKQLYRLQYIYLKFRAVLGIIQASSYFMWLIIIVSDVEIPWWTFIVVLFIGGPLLILFTFSIEMFGDSWHVDKWTDFKIRASELFYEQTVYNMLKNAKTFKMAEKEKIEKTKKHHEILGLDDIGIELEILLELRARKDKEKKMKEKAKNQL